MKIVIALGNTADTGGPTKYAQNLEREFIARGHTVRFVSYAPWMWRLPSGARHLCYMARLLPAAATSDFVFAFDTMTVGAPAVLVCTSTRTPLIIRIGGDFVWEQYVERTGDLVKLSNFYRDTVDKLSTKERLEIWLTGVVVRHAAMLLFNSQKQRSMWQPVYRFNFNKSSVLENLYPPRKQGFPPEQRVFVSAGRPIKLKNEPLLRRVFARLQKRYLDIVLDTESLPAKEHAERVAHCYAVIVASISEVTSNAIIDAVAYGKPFICTSDTGLVERLLGTGYFIDTQHEQELEHAIEQLLNKEEYERVAARVRAFAFVRTWDDIANDVLAIAQNICAL
ncbi:MAG: glycosyltransferase [Minisyncoccia bacterium]|jgi:glycosyltransferase involved in cell wall biosynthesis